MGPSSIEIELGNCLGVGGFCTVVDLDEVHLNPSKSEREKPVQEDRLFISSHCTCDGKPRYAVKKLTRGLYREGNEQHFVSGVMDLMVEVQYLSVLATLGYPNIIKMRAVSSCPNYSKGFFIIMDRLNETLTDRVKTWAAESKKQKRLPRLMNWTSKKGRTRQDLLHEKLNVCQDLFSVMSFLHKHK